MVVVVESCRHKEEKVWGMVEEERVLEIVAEEERV
jgi:hypothetical protein